jgi:endonuclease-3
MAVDTHVFRVSKRLGLVSEDAPTPLAVEKELVKNIPEQYIAKAHHWLILHGRYVCVARSPKCGECQIAHICKYYEHSQKGKTMQIRPYSKKKSQKQSIIK